MAVFYGRQDYRAGSQFAVEVKGMTAFINTPTVILTPPKEVRRFPKVLTVIAYPDPSGFVIDTHPPGIAQTENPVLGTRILQSQERIILWYRVRPIRVRMIDINAQNAAIEIA